MHVFMYLLMVDKFIDYMWRTDKYTIKDNLLFDILDTKVFITIYETGERNTIIGTHTKCKQWSVQNRKI